VSWEAANFVSWEAANAGLQANLVVSIALSPEFERDHTLYLAGLEDGVSVSTDAGASWECANAGLGTATAVLGLAASPDGVYAATSAGVFHTRGRADEWKQVHPAPARAVRAEGRRVVALGMHGALVASADGAASWRPLEWPASAGQAKSVALAGPSRLFVGSTLSSTSEVAVWESTLVQGWQRVLVEPASDVAALPVPLAHVVDGTIFAGIGDTVMRTAEGRLVWHRAGLPGTVTSLEASPAYRTDTTILAGTTAGACISRDAGLTFEPWGAGMDNAPVIAVAFSPAYATDRLVYALELGGRVWRNQNA